MEEKEMLLIKKIEKLNEEYLNSGDYSLGIYTKYLYSLFKNKKFIQLFRMIMLHFKQKKVKEDIDNIYKEQSTYIVDNKQQRRIAIYTCITGEYDNVEEPLIAEKACDYFLFTNNNSLKSNVWNIKEIPEGIKKISNNAKINRYIKMHPKELFPDYDYAIYIDGNVKIISIISQLVNKINSKTGLAIHRHCQRTCIYEEIKACRAYKKGKYCDLKKQVNRYKKEKFPNNYGMLECNMIVSDLNNNNANKILSEWWHEYLKSESMRDQIALPYILWKKNLKIDDVGNLGNNINKNYLLKINTHK